MLLNTDITQLENNVDLDQLKSHAVSIQPTKPIFNHLYSGNLLTSTFANSEDPDEMQYNAAFHQGLHCLYRLKNHQSKEYNIF